MTTFCVAFLGLLMLTGCEGSELYQVGAPDWLQAKIDSIAENGSGESYVDFTPNPTELGAADNSTGWWTVFTDDVKIEAGLPYRVMFTNYGGASNYNNFVMILRNGIAPGEEGYYEYGILRSDNWCWNSEYTDGADSDNWCTKKMESSERTWETWLKAMNRADCVATINNKGDGTCDVEIVMYGSDGKTYKQSYLGIPVNPDDLYLSFTVDGSHIVFGEPVEVEDSEPVSIELVGVPKKVMVGATVEETFANMGATVKFENGLTTTVGFDDLKTEVIPDLTTLGTKTIVAVYNKTYLGKNSTTPMIARADFQVVDKMYTLVGAADNSGAFWSAHSDNIKVAAGETFVSTFTNYSSCEQNYHNFLVVLCKEDNTEYGVLRADNYGWGAGYEGIATATIEDGRDWSAWLKAMNGAKVTTYVTNNGDNTADVTAIMVGNDGVTYTQNYKGVQIDSNNFYFRFTIERAHLEFDTVVGAEDNSGAFWSGHSADFVVPAGKTYSMRFKNYSSCEQNFHNFLVVLTKADNSEYAVLRADNYGWGTSYEGIATATMEEGRDWAVWRDAMDEATVTVSVTNNGTSADVKAVMVGSDGKTYTQNYSGIAPIEADDFRFRFTIERAHLVFE